MSSPTLYDALQETTQFIGKTLTGRRPALGLILGSGLGEFADTLESPTCIDYVRIPHFFPSTVIGHKGRLVIGEKSGVLCVAMQGRVHCYEGHPAATVAYPTRALIHLGARTLLVTNAAGGLNEDWEPGTLMLITDHLNLTGDNPLRGPNDDRIGPRFPDMTTAYAPELRELAILAAERLKIPLKQGIYAGLSGPSYETPAEIRMLRGLGADAVGMSTVPEVIVAQHMGARVLGISCITNKAAGMEDAPLSHDEVTETAVKVRHSFQLLLDEIICDFGRDSGSQPHDQTDS